MSEISGPDKNAKPENGQPPAAASVPADAPPPPAKKKKEPWTLRRAFKTAVNASVFLSIVATAGSALIGGLMLAGSADVSREGHEWVYGIPVPGTNKKIPLLSSTAETREDTRKDEKHVAETFGIGLTMLGLTYLLNRKVNPESNLNLKKAEAPAAPGPPKPPAQTPPAPKA